MAKALRAPFPPDQVGKLPRVTCGDCSDKRKTCDKHQKKVCRTCKAYVSERHTHLDYVGHAHVTERLLAVDPDWSWEPFALNGMGLPALDDVGGLWIRLKIGGKVMIGYGDAPGKERAVKELIGDAIRNAAMRFGVALDLWKKEAPEPVADQPAARQREEATLTPAQRAGQLRALIAQMGKQDDKTIDDIAAEFHEWSGKRHEINTASVAVLAEYVEHLKAKP
jgi:hypothetical protein